MALTVPQVVAHLESRYGLLEELGIYSQDVQAWITTALERTKEWAVENGHAVDFQREDTITLDAGDDTIPSSADIPTDMLSGRLTRVRHTSSNYDFTDAGSLGRLALIYADAFGYFAIEQGKVFLKGPTGAADPLDGDALVTGVAAPALGSLLDKYIPHFLDELTELAAERKHVEKIGPDQEGKQAA